jgi:hypothetical protein
VREELLLVMVVVGPPMLFKSKSSKVQQSKNSIQSNLPEPTEQTSTNFHLQHPPYNQPTN